ncbi:MAG: hypothetical protein B7Y35_07450 [Sphingomonadales bacterium 28-64-96]|nr:MAG: hypothetical protein B7Y35_07450 [Sphingomonadales bacterium 28-64-96]
MQIAEQTPIVGDAAAARALLRLITPSSDILPLDHGASNNLSSSLAKHGRWTVAAIEEEGPPPRFGQYAACSPINRCVGCSSSCQTQSLVDDVQSYAGGDVLLLNVGSSFDAPNWARVQISIPGSPALSGISIPIIDHAGQLALAIPEASFMLCVEDDTYAAKSIWQSSAVLATQHALFIRRLMIVRAAIMQMTAAVNAEVDA